MGVVNGGQFRHSIERMDPAHYLGSSYYEHWATGVATRLLEVGKLTIDELEAKAGGRFPLSRPEQAATVEDPGPDVDAPRFGPGDAVRVRNVHPAGHTRCPRYIRGRRGTVIRNDKIASVPDVEAHTDGRRRKEPTYSVAFDAAELWGADGERGVTIHVDLWDSYLEPAL
jgi:nitrile hydratase subunit beta